MAANRKLKAIVFLSSVREPRNADRVLPFIKGVLQKHFDVKVFDPKELQLPLVSKPLHFYPDQSKAPEQLRKLNDEIKEADALVFVTGEYNRGVPPPLTNMLDHFSPGSYAWKAGVTVSYSVSPLGGNLAPALLLTTLRDFGVQLIPSSITIPVVEKALSADGQVQSGQESIQQSADWATNQLVWLAQALKAAREKTKPPKSHVYLPD
jgi:NAD(P)H-dependent FMN reductase